MINHPNRSRVRKIAATAEPQHNHEEDYAKFLISTQATFDASVAGGSRLFATDTQDLFDVFLSHLPAERDIHTCTACRRFVNSFGGLVTITEAGEPVPALWGASPDFYAPAIVAMSKVIRRSRVDAPFLSRDPVWGTPKTGAWTHIAVNPAAAASFRDRLLTPNQAMAAKREDFKTVANALADFTAPMLEEALRLLETESLRMSERFISPVRWLLDLHTRRAAARGKARDNILWRAIASAPDGYCHPRASVVGSLLEDIAAGKSFEEVRGAFNAKVAPLAYQRPQAPPTSGNIAAAEKIVEKMGIQPSLERRYARLEDLETIWVPRGAGSAQPLSGGVFGHLEPKGSASAVALDIPAITMTWAKFCGVLPMAEAMEMLTPSGASQFIAFTAAVNSDAPPILKWDREDARNHVAWYVYPGGSPASQWGLRTGSWTKVVAITPLPTLWGDKPSPFLGEGAALILDGCVDTRDAGNALFPSCLRDDLHQVRSTIEAYSRSAKLSGREEASACGFDIRKGATGINAMIRVLASGRWTTYRIDRWD